MPNAQTRTSSDLLLPAELTVKWKALLNAISEYQSLAVAFSGGVDSSLLAFAANFMLGPKAVALTLLSPLTPIGTRQLVVDFANRYQMNLVLLEVDLLQNPKILSNPVDRCYYCKKEMLSTLWGYAIDHQIPHLLDGQNEDDLKQYRPGSKAVTESGAISPLMKFGFSKNEIRQVCRALGLAVWDQPSSPCLATRIPYGTLITQPMLEKIDRAESYLRNLGYRNVRVRNSQSCTRIEVDLEQVEQLFKNAQIVKSFFTTLGFQEVEIDHRGYRSGSLDEGINI